MTDFVASIKEQSWRKEAAQLTNAIVGFNRSIEEMLKVCSSFIFKFVKPQASFS